MPRTNRVPAIVVALAVVIALPLAGCVPQSSAPQTTAPPVTPRPSVTAQAPEGRSWPYELGCADVLPSSVLEEFIPGAQVLVDESSAPRSIFEVAQLGGGGLVCQWGADGAQVTVQAVGDYDSSFALAQGYLEVGPDCGVDACGSVELHGAIGVSTTWSTVGLPSRDSFDGLRQHIAEAFADPKPRSSVWQPPTGALDAATYCSESGQGRAEFGAAIDDALGLPAGTAQPAGGGGFAPWVDEVAAERGGYGICGWMWGATAGDALFVTFATGGAWALADLDPGFTLTPVELPGFPARGGCFDHGCKIFLAAGDSLIEMDSGDPAVTLQELESTASMLAPALFGAS